MVHREMPDGYSGMEESRAYIAIDLKSFYASAECVDRGIDPLDTNLVVADVSRTEKTICLAVTPSLKRYGIPGRARLFEVVQRIKEINAERQSRAPGHRLVGSSYKASELDASASLAADYITAPPRMSRYIEISSRIYGIYLNYISPDDIHVYSVDEVFINAAPYLRLYGCTAKELAEKLVADVYNATGITATAGIGTNLYLCKIAMDIVAKHKKPDSKGMRIAELDEAGYRRLLWTHRPITDFWRVGRGISEKLAAYGMYTMGDVARCSEGRINEFYNEDLLYRLFGVNAELLIDHAWGYEPCTISEIKAYIPESHSLSSGQVLKEPYEFDKAKIVIKEMADMLALDMTAKKVAADQIILNVGYDTENVSGINSAAAVKKFSDFKIKGGGGISIRNAGNTGNTGNTGNIVNVSNINNISSTAIVKDHYGRFVPKPAHGSRNIGFYTAASSVIIKTADELFENIVSKNLSIRRITISAAHVISASEAERINSSYRQLTLFEQSDSTSGFDADKAEKDRHIQESLLSIKKRYGKNAVLRGMNFLEGATAAERNSQIGGHKA